MKLGIVGGTEPDLSRYITAFKQLNGVSISGTWLSDAVNGHAHMVDHIPVYGTPELLIEDSEALVFTGNEKSDLIKRALRSAKHVFLYPSAIPSVHEANAYLNLAAEANVILKMGRIGKVNCHGLIQTIGDPSGVYLIELQFSKKFTGENSFQSVYESLLINAQVIHALVKSQVLSVKAKGLLMVSDQPGIINVRLDYDNGCAINLTSNIVADHDKYTGTFVMKDSCITYDFYENQLAGWNIRHSHQKNFSPFSVGEIKTGKYDVLAEDIREFTRSAETGLRSSTKGNNFEPYILVEHILEKVQKSIIRYD